MAPDDQNDQMTDENEDKENGNGLVQALTSKELLIPAGLSAAGALAATMGPGIVKRLANDAEDKGGEQAEELGEKAAEGAKKSLTGGTGIAGRVLSKAVGGSGGGGSGSGAKKTRRLPIQRWTDVAVPVDKAYDGWTKFEAYPQFMHRVLSIEPKGKDRIAWQEKIWFSKRQWEGRITDRRKNDRIAWKTTSGMSHSGVVSFHKVGDNLTRVMVTIEFEPNGMIEKMASGLRFVKRAVQADLARFKAWVEMEDAKGIEYRPVRDEDDEEKDEASGRQAKRNGSENGSRDDADEERRDREERRKERRAAA
jgi:uncharacterized membrane protein